MRQHILDVRHHSFTRRLRGADPREVETVLTELAPSCDELRDTLGQLQLELAAAKTELERLLQGERSVIRLFASAEEHARMCLGSAQREATRITESAEERARALLAQAEDDRVRWTSELGAIETRREQVFAAIEQALTSAVPGPAALRHATGESPAPSETRPVLVGAWPSVPESRPLAPSIATPESVEDHDVTWSADELSTVFDPLPGSSVPPADAPEHDSTTESSTDETPLRAHPQWWRTARVGRIAAAAAVLIATGAMAIPVARGSRVPTATPRPAPHAPTPARASNRAALPLPETTAEVAGQPASSDPVVLRLTALRECWLRVTVDGRAEEMTLEEGAELTRGGKDRIQLRVGDASAATIEINGQVLPPLGRRGQVVSRTFTAASAQAEASAATASEPRPGA